MPTAKLYLERHEAVKLRTAAFNSKAIGYPFTHFLTINLGLLGYAPIDCMKSWQTMQRAMKGLHRRHSLPFVIAWVFERQATGVHVHCLIYLGDLSGKDYRPHLLKALNLKHPPRGSIDITAFHSNKSWQTNMDGLLDYMCKGIRPEHADMIDKQAKQQGFIIGKRYGFTRNLSPKTDR